MRNWDDLRVFLAVARAESLTAAAPMLRMDPATASRRIARLEAALGSALFVKSPQGYLLTDRGRRVLDDAQAAEGPMMRALERGAADHEGLSGQVRIGAPDGCANYLLPQVCTKIQRANPGLDIQVLALPRVVNLSQREADMAITVSPPQAGRLTVQKITDYQLHLAMRRDQDAPAALAEVRGYPVVGYIPDMIFDRELDYLGGLAADGVQLASNSIAVQLQMLREGGGIGIVHDFALSSAPELRRILTQELSLSRSFYLVRHAADRPSERLSRIAELLLAGLRAEVLRLEQEVALTEGGRLGDAQETK